MYIKLPVITVPTNNDTDTNMFPASAPYSVVILPFNILFMNNIKFLNKIK